MNNEQLNDKVSVIIVTYRRLEYLKIALQSILNQTHKNLEVIIISDGHDNEVQEYVAGLNNSEISYFYVDHCGYPAKGRNLGITKATGKFIAFCDDDDVWQPYKLEKQLNIFSSDSSIGLCCTNRSIINSNGQLINSHSLNWIPQNPNLNNLLITNYISYSSVVIKKSILEKSGVFFDGIKFKAIEDYHLWLRIAYFTNIYFLNEPLIGYRMHAANISEKLSDGAKKNKLLYKDLFSKYKFNSTDKFKALFVVNIKYIIYKLRNK